MCICIYVYTYIKYMYIYLHTYAYKFTTETLYLAKPKIFTLFHLYSDAPLGLIMFDSFRGTHICTSSC